ncbi:MAG TPA: radical SAM protein [Dehalococcoidia bacterium]|nr:radical SAM protein [Dehalococcoidia bacterium]
MATSEMNLPPGFELETETETPAEVPEGFEVEPMNLPEGFVLEETPAMPEQEGDVLSQIGGAFMRGWMSLGTAVVDMPKHIVTQVKLPVMATMADEVLGAKDPKQKMTKLQDMRKVEDFFGTVTTELGRAGEWHREGVKAIVDKHPEWETEPPKNFVDLVTSPDKIAVALAESTPILLGAGIFTAAGVPNMAIGLMYAAEGQQAYDQAIQDNASKDDAEAAYHIYGSVSCALEQMQLQGIMKIGKGMFNAVTKRTAQKVAAKGMKSLTMDVIRVAGQEALEEISQAAWQDMTAKIVYDKSIPGGITGTIDRYAQAGLIGGLMGIIPGAGGAAVGKFAVATSDVRGHVLSGVAEEDIAQDPDLADEEKEKRQLIVGNIRTRLVQNVVQQFPKEVTNQATLQEVGDAIAGHLGVEKKINWMWSTRPVFKRMGWHRSRGPKQSEITINAEHPRHINDQKAIKETIIHEIGHIMRPPEVTTKGRRKIHHKAFNQWYENNKGALEQLVEQQEPVAEPVGMDVTPPSIDYSVATTKSALPDRRGGKNLWMRKQHDAASNKGRHLLIQFSSPLLTTEEDPEAKAYFDKLYSTRKGYDRLEDFWEVPGWMGAVANTVPNSDAYVVRDVDEAIQFLAKSGYKKIFFSSLDINKDFIRQIAENFDGEVIVGGYAPAGYFKGIDNVKTYNSIEEMAKVEGYGFKPGIDMSFFAGSSVQARLCMSKGCLHKCAFCTVPKGVTEVTDEMIDSQIEAMADLDAEYVYLDDKTFGQSKNYKKLVGIRKKLQKKNPRFKGFIVQTTAAQMEKFSDEFLQKSGIKYIELGIESYNDPILKKLHKPAREALIDKATEKLRKNSIALIPNIMIGLPGEDATTYRRTLDFIRRNFDIISHLNINNLALYEGTELADVLEAKSTLDVDENTVVKSFHDNPQDHINFSKEVFALGNELLDKPSIIELAEPPAEARVEKPTKDIRRQFLIKGHQIPRQLGMDEIERRKYMGAITGKTSMKDMTLKEMRQYVGQLEAAAVEVGITPETPEMPEDPTGEMIQSIDQARRKPIPEDIEELNKPKLQQWWDQTKNMLTTAYDQFRRMERTLEFLDGHKEGPNYNNIWKPIKAAEEATVETTNSDIANFMSILEEKNIPVDQWVGKAQDIEGETISGKKRTFRLTPAQRIGVHTLKQNKNGLRYLRRGMGFSDVDLQRIEESMSNQEKEVAEWLLDQYDKQFPILEKTANIVGLTVGKEIRYAPIIRRDLDLEFQPDFLSELASTFTSEKTGPEAGMIQERKPGAYGKLELDAFVSYMYNLSRVNRFINMAPVAANLQIIMRNKEYKATVNSRTAGQGTRLLNTFIKDSVRGTTGESYTWFERFVSIFRRNGIAYAIGWSIPSSLRQTLSMSNAVAVDPLMTKYTPINIARAAYPKGYQAMEKFVHDRSAVARTRSFDRDLRRIWNKRTITKRLKGKSLSPPSLAWIRWMDRHTVVVAWKSLYDTALEKDMKEQDAIAYADKWIGRTQPMANPKDLPAFYRGGVMERLVTTFQNQVNQNFNFYLHDIGGAYRYGKISPAIVAYRTMFSWILPAILYGMIGRARLPKKPSELIIDLATYPLAGVVLFGRWIQAAIKGWGDSGTVATIAPTEAQKTVAAARRGNLFDVIIHASKAIGAATGMPTAQMVRTAEGAVALAKEETKDPRRLIYSKWALEEGKPKKKRGLYYD